MVAYSGTDEKSSEPAFTRLLHHMYYQVGTQGTVHVRNTTGFPFWCNGADFTHGNSDEDPGSALVASGGEVFLCRSIDSEAITGSISWTSDTGLVSGPSATVTVRFRIPYDGHADLEAEISGERASEFTTTTADGLVEVRPINRQR